MARTKLTVHQTRRLPEWLTCERAAPRQRAKRTYPYKIKLTRGGGQNISMTVRIFKFVILLIIE